MNSISRLGEWCAIAVMTCGSAFGAVPADNAEWTINQGETETVTIGDALSTLKSLHDNGTLIVEKNLTIAYGGAHVHAIAYGENATGTLTIRNNATLTISGTVDNNNGHALAVGQLGGTGTVNIESGSSLILNNLVLNPGRNDNDHRSLPSQGIFNISGTLSARRIENCPWYPTRNAADYESYVVSELNTGSIYNLNEGGVLEFTAWSYNDIARNVINFNGGTIRLKATLNPLISDVASAYEWNIASGKNLIFDTQNYHSRIVQSSIKPSFSVIQGEGGLVKKGSGLLRIELTAESNTFSGPITVEQGEFYLGRPLLENQTVLVKTGAKFYPYCDDDLAKITYETPAEAPANGALFIVAAPYPEGIDLLGMAPTYRTDAIGGTDWGWGGSVNGTITHSAATTQAPFNLVGSTISGPGAVTLTNTGLEAVPLKLSGNTEFTFAGDREFGFTDPGYLQFDETAPGKYKQSGKFDVRSGTGTAVLDWTKGLLTSGGRFSVGDGDGNTGKVVMNDGAKLTVNGQLSIGYNGGNAEFHATNATITTTGNISIGGTDSNRHQSRTKTSFVNTAIDNGANGEFKIAPTSPNGGGDRTTLMNEVVFGPGATLACRRITRNDDPYTKVTVNGLTYTPAVAYSGFVDGSAIFYSGQFGTFDWEITEGNYLDINMGSKDTVMTCGHSCFHGAGGIRLTAVAPAGTPGDQGTLPRFFFCSVSNGANGVQPAVFDWRGGTIINGGVGTVIGNDVFPHGSAGCLFGGSGDGMFDLDTHDQRIGGFTADAYLDFRSAKGGAFVGVGEADTGAFNFSKTLQFGAALEKLGPGTMTVSAVLHNGMLVSEGAAQTANSAPCYRYYRFKVEGTRGSTSANMQVAEFKLMDGAVDVTRLGTLGFDSNKGGHSGTYPANESPAQLVDGNIGTKWLDNRVAASAQQDRDRVWITLTYPQPQRVTHYALCTANDHSERDPVAWRVQGSSDGTSWTDLDVKSGAILSNFRWRWAGPFPLCGAVLGSTDGALDVASGASFTADGGTVPVRSISGAVTLANDATLLSGGGAIVGTVSGNGGLVKNGDDTLDVFGEHTYTGLTRVEKGTLNLGGVAHAPIASFGGKYFRWIVRGVRHNSDAVTGSAGSNGYVAPLYQASEFQLLDADGAVQSQGLAKRANRLPAESLSPGQFSLGCDLAYTDSGTTHEGPEKLFDGDTGTKSHMTTTLGLTPDSWIVYNMRLSDSAHPITGYKIFTGNDRIGRDPQDWVLQGSYDGIEWTTLDEHVGYPCSAGRKASLSGDNPFALNGPLPRYRAFDGKYIRITFKKTSGNTILQMSELMLYDRHRNRVNLNLVNGTDGAAANTLAAGSFCKGANYSNSNTEGPEKLFDGNPGTKWCTTGVNLDGNSANWRVITMRLKDDANPVVSYNFITANDGAVRNPCDWLVEGSYDGVTWETLDEQTSVPNPNYLYTPLANDFPIRWRGANSLASVVQVDDGATLNLADGATIGGLRIDDAGAGTVNGLNPAANGTLELVNVPASTPINGYEAPLTVNLAAGASTQLNWSVKVNGQNCSYVRAKVNSDNHIELCSTYTIIYVR